MIVTMGKPDKVLDEAVKHILDDVQKRIDEAYQRT
jgi:S-adenosylmethionine synthetase